MYNRFFDTKRGTMQTNRIGSNEEPKIRLTRTLYGEGVFVGVVVWCNDTV